MSRPALVEGSSIRLRARPATLPADSDAVGKERVTVVRNLIVARMEPSEAEAVAGIFAESDASELPHLIGVDRRTLFRFHDLYFHLVEASEDITPNLYRARSHPLYADINTRRASHIRPYDPGWKEPKDAMAEPFYSWSRS